MRPRKPQGELLWVIQVLDQLASMARAGALKYAHVRHASKSRWIGRDCAPVHHGEASTVFALPWGTPPEIQMLFTALFCSSSFHVLQLVKGHQYHFCPTRMSPQAQHNH